MRKLLAAVLAASLACAVPADAGLHFHGAATEATFTTFDPAFGNLTPDNLTFQSASGVNGARSVATLPASACTHIEITAGSTDTWTVGVANATHPVTGNNSWAGADTDSVGVSQNATKLYAGTSQGGTTPAFTIANGETLAMEVDTSTHQIIYQKAGAGAWTAAMDFTPSTGTYPVTGPYYVIVEGDHPAAILTANFGATSFLVTATGGCVGLS